MFKVNKTIKTPKRRQWRRFGGVFFANFEHVSHLVLVFLLLTWAGECRLVMPQVSLYPSCFLFSVGIERDLWHEIVQAEWKIVVPFISRHSVSTLFAWFPEFPLPNSVFVVSSITNDALYSTLREIWQSSFDSKSSCQPTSSTRYRHHWQKKY